jgi:hypothetical protein
MMVRCTLLSLVTICLAAAGCSEKTTEPDVVDSVIDDAGGFDAPPGGWARVIPNTAFEGLNWLVIGLQSQSAGGGPDLTGATVTIDDFGDEVLISEQRCNRVRCALVIEVTEFMPPIGQPIPPPIEAQNVMLRIDPPSGEWMVGTLSVFPLDYTDHFTPSMPLRFKGHYMMSSFRMTAGTRLEANDSELESVGRLFVAGPVELAGLLDMPGGDALGTEPGLPGLGAGQGGASMAPGLGPGGGLAGTGGGGGGGGSYGGSGTAGDEGTGTAGAPGDTYGSMNVECVMDAEAAHCAGSGGGGGTSAAGGGGGSSMLVVSLDSITLDGAVFDVSGGTGGDGDGAGGGGSGGNIWLLAPRITGTAEIDSRGGTGGSGASSGGTGGAGRIRIDGEKSGATLTLSPDYSFSGPVIDKTTLELIDTDGHITVTGWADEGAELRIAVDNQSGFSDRNFDGIAGTDGTFTIEVDLSPGVSSLTLSQNLSGLVTYGFVGNTFEVAGTTAVVGTLLYVASVPDGE